MAQRRMFSLKVIDTDEFLDMPQTSQYLYYNLAMRADDDGFVSKPKIIMRMVNCNSDDFKVLIAKRFIIPFERGVCVIRHWLIHNLIRKDRYNETEYLKERDKLQINNGKYSLKTDGIPNDIPSGNHLATNGKSQVRLGKVRLGKVKKDSSIGIEGKNSSYKGENWVKEILIWLEVRRGVKFSDYGKQISALGRLQKAGYEPEQIKRHLIIMEREEFWRDKSPDFVNLSGNIHKIRR